MNGFININKAGGYTSHDVVACLRRILSIKKIGHTGTLDPSATGVLPICVGNATRLSEYAMDSEKSYQATIVFGITTTTDDFDGEIISRQICGDLTKESINENLNRFIGMIEQKPPMFSAVKYNGKRLYQHARQGVIIDAPLRKVIVHSIEIITFEEGDYPTLSVYIRCSKGTYIRSIARDLGLSMGCGASLKSLIRTRSGGFDLSQSYTLENVQSMFMAGDMSFLLPTKYVVSHLPSIIVDDVDINRVLCGAQVAIKQQRDDYLVCSVFSGDGLLLGIGNTSKGILTMRKVLHNNSITTNKTM